MHLFEGGRATWSSSYVLLNRENLKYNLKHETPDDY